MQVRFKLLDAFKNIRYFSTTRFYEGYVFNPGFVNHINKNLTVNDRTKLSHIYNIPLSSFVFGNQTHSDHITHINAKDKGKGLYRKEDAVANNDAFICTEPDICPVVFSADCVPIILFDPINSYTAVIHSGWRGTLNEILLKTISKLNQLGSNSSDIICCNGPSAGPCCYEVKDDVFQLFNDKYPHLHELILTPFNNQWKLNLWELLKYQALSSGILQKNIEISEICTMCNLSLFHSARIHKDKSGRNATGIYLIPDNF